jgi:C4-dicarboxylate-specific signal transduction histidine kinase
MELFGIEIQSVPWTLLVLAMACSLWLAGAVVRRNRRLGEANAKLEEAHRDLAQRVEERTAELAASNARLRADSRGR